MVRRYADMSSSQRHTLTSVRDCKATLRSLVEDCEATLIPSGVRTDPNFLLISDAKIVCFPLACKLMVHFFIHLLRHVTLHATKLLQTFISCPKMNQGTPDLF